MVLHLHPRDEVWPGQIPFNSIGTKRPLLGLNRPILTVHYTGGGLWTDPGDTPTELRSLQIYAISAKKPWEYNYVIDSEGHAWEYAGRYRAAHSEGENDIAIGVLMWVGLGDAKKLTGFEKVSDEMVLAFRQLREFLVSVNQLDSYAKHQVIKHRDMPGAATICPGPEVIARWNELTKPITDDLPVPQPPIPQPPPQGAPMTDMYLIQQPGDNKVWGVINVRGKRRRVHLTPSDFSENLAECGPVLTVPDVGQYGAVLGHVI